jgi:hypothetical protein
MINKERYRADYDGEFVITKIIYRDGQKITEKEYIENPIANQHISGRAVVIASGHSLRKDVVTAVSNHGGGLLGQKKLQTYGCEGVWKKMRLDFCVEYDIPVLNEIKAANYNENSVVYTLTTNCLKMPGEFYLIPYCLRLAPPAAAAYLAAFDGHQEVFLLGVDGTTKEYHIDHKHIIDIKQVLQAYPNTKFYFVTDHADPYDEWRAFKNAEVLDYRQFVLHCDV